MGHRPENTLNFTKLWYKVTKFLQSAKGPRIATFSYIWESENIRANFCLPPKLLLSID